jgi:hypothetical protein
MAGVAVYIGHEGRRPWSLVVRRSAAGLTSIIGSILLSACVTPAKEFPFPYQGEFGQEQTFTGELALSFERQSFDECWLDFRGSAGADLGRLAPSPALADDRGVYSAHVTLIGRRRNVINGTRDTLLGQGFGHLRMYPCLIEATSITAARLRAR